MILTHFTDRSFGRLENHLKKPELTCISEEVKDLSSFIQAVFKAEFRETLENPSGGMDLLTPPHHHHQFVYQKKN